MATVPAPGKIPPSAKYDAQVLAQLTRAERRVRNLDLAAGLLGLLGLTLGYVLVMVLLHWKLHLPVAARQIALVLYLVGAGAYLMWMVILPLRRPINPRFAALQLERTLPRAKNSLVNYIDLRDEELPPAIRSALSRRAAKDVTQADVEQAIPGKSAGIAGAIAAGLGILCLTAMLAVGFGDFFRLLGGVFAPAAPTDITAPPGPRIRVVIRQPEGGNASVAAGSAVSFVVQVEGDLPPGEERAPKLVVAYPQSGDSLVRALNRPRRAGGDWTVDLSALEIRDGFTYKVTAGDVESAEYRVTVFSTPTITAFQATYNYRPYLGEPRFRVQTVNRSLRAWRGTEIVLRVQTNAAVENAEVEINAKAGARTRVEAITAAEDGDAFEARFLLTETGTYRLRFKPKKGESYADPVTYELVADPDLPPHRVELTAPGKDISLPANGLLKLEAVAEDDIGVRGATLHMKLVGGVKLKDRPYRSDKELRLPGGGYLTTLAYKDAVDLAAITKDADGKPVTLKAGDRLEYWLSAHDACDYPAPNPAVETKQHFFVTLTAPEQDPAKAKKDRDKAKKEQKEHQAKQDEERRQDDKQRKEQQKEAEEKQQAGKKDDGQKSDKNDAQSKVDPDRQNDINAEAKRGEENERRSQEDKPGDGDKPGKQDDNTGQQGAGKDAKPSPAESKSEPRQDGNSAEQQQKNKGEGKEQGKDNDGKQGQGKECKNPGGQGQGKDGSKGEPMAGKEGDGKGSDPMAQQGEKPAEAKNDSPPSTTSASSTGAGKGGNSKGADGQAAKGKTGPDANTTAETKPQGKDAQVADNKPTGIGKEEQFSQSDPSGAKAKEDAPKESPSTAKGGPSGNGDHKDGPQKTDAPNTAQAKGDPEQKKRDAGGDVSKIDAKEPLRKDLENLIKALENGDKKQRDKALDKLDEIAKKADDPNLKEAADNLSKKAKDLIEKTAEKEDAGSEKDPPAQGDGKTADSKDGPGDTKGDPAKGKEGQPGPMGKNGAEKGPGRSQGIDEKGDPGKATVKGPANPFGRRDEQGDTRAQDDPTGPARPIDPLSKANTTLQLKPFDRKDWLNREAQFLKPAKPTPDEPRTANTGINDKTVPSKSTTLPSTGGERRPDPMETTTDPLGADRTQLPPAYRKAIQEYTKEK